MASADNYALSLEEKTAEREFYKSVHDKFDKDKSGGLDINEFSRLIGWNNEVAIEIASDVFEAGDKNRDGVLSFEEMQEMVNDKSHRKLFQRYINTYIQFVLPPRHRRHLAVESHGCYPLPLAMLLMSAFEMACFIMDKATEKDSTLRSGVTAQLFVYNPRQRGQAWRFLTYIFVHTRYMHLLMNILVQLILGVPLEMVHNWWRVLLIYFSGAIAGSLATSVTDPTRHLAGASGGVYAIITAHIATIIMNWNDMYYPLIQLTFFILVTSADIGTAIYNRYWRDISENIGYTAHIAGAIAGLLVGIWVLKNFTLTKNETYIWWTALLTYIVSMGVMVLMNVFWTSHFQLK